MQEQTDQKFQVLIIDDNSTDETVKIVQEFAQNLRLEIEVKNTTAIKGAAESLNLTFGLIKTPYFALLDSDAYLADNWLEEMRAILDDGAQITGAPILAHKQNSTLGYLAGLEIESRYFRLRQRQEVIHLSTCNLMGRTEILNDIRLDSNLRYGYDHQFSYLLGQKNINFTLNKRTYCYHHNKTGLSAFLKQQFLIGYHQFRLSFEYTRQAGKNDAISGWVLSLQPPLFMAATATLLINYHVSLVIIAVAILLNYHFLSYLYIKKEWSLLPAAILMILVRMAVWTTAILAGLVSLIISK